MSTSDSTFINSHVRPAVLDLAVKTESLVFPPISMLLSKSYYFVLSPTSKIIPTIAPPIGLLTFIALYLRLLRAPLAFVLLGDT